MAIGGVNFEKEERLQKTAITIYRKKNRKNPKRERRNENKNYLQTFEVYIISNYYFCSFGWKLLWMFLLYTFPLRLRHCRFATAERRSREKQRCSGCNWERWWRVAVEKGKLRDAGFCNKRFHISTAHCVVVLPRLLLLFAAFFFNF